jgi:hypothetical protein
MCGMVSFSTEQDSFDFFTVLIVNQADTWIFYRLSGTIGIFILYCEFFFLKCHWLRFNQFSDKVR